MKYLTMYSNQGNVKVRINTKFICGTHLHCSIKYNEIRLNAPKLFWLGSMISARGHEEESLEPCASVCFSDPGLYQQKSSVMSSEAVL